MHRSIALVCVTALATSAASATAASLITGKDVQNGSLTGADIKKGSIPLNRLSKGTQDRINRLGAVQNTPAGQGERGQDGANGQNGQNGRDGANGQNGAKGDKGDRGDGQIIVTEAGNGWSVTNPSVKFTPNGVTFGPYANSSVGGSVKFTALPEGTTLGDIANITYTASYTHTGSTPDNGDAPYFRIFMDDDNDGKWDGASDPWVTFTPSLQAGACHGGGAASGACNASGRMIKYEVTKGTVRYKDDPGTTPEVPWSKLVNEHKDDKVVYLLVTTGFSQQGTESGVLNSLSYEIAGQQPTTVSFSR